MANFVFDNQGARPRVSLEAHHGEEMTVEMIAAWAALKQASALDDIANALVGIDNAINRAADIMTDIPSR